MPRKVAGLFGAGVGMLLLVCPAPALEKAPVPLGDREHSEAWERATSLTIAYYNFCTGWIWSWGGWDPGDRLGVTFNAPHSAGLFGSWIFVSAAAPSGYGFTGTVEVYNHDDGCPVGAPLASQPFLPAQYWNFQIWAIPVPPNLMLLATLGPTSSNPIRFGSDHPAAGPTGAIACGTCYPTTRMTHSFYYGSAPTTPCPGDPFFDGTADAELLWDILVSVPTALQSESWASVKALYR